MQKLRVIGWIAFGAFLLTVTGCHVSSLDDPNRTLKARVRANDSSAARQLASGFYAVENNAWRWTAGKFAIVLPLSNDARAKGATLNLKLSFPAAEIAQIGSTTLSADANGAALAPETFSKAGDFTYSRDLPTTALTGSTARVNFVLSKSMPPTGQDVRELGAVVHEVSLKTK